LEGKLAQQARGEDGLDRVELLLDVERHERVERNVEGARELDQLGRLGVLFPLLDLGEVGDREARSRRDRLQRLALLLAEGLQLQAEDVAKLVAVERRVRGGRPGRFADREILPLRFQRIFAYKVFSRIGHGSFAAKDPARTKEEGAMTQGWESGETRRLA